MIVPCRRSGHPIRRRTANDRGRPTRCRCLSPVTSRTRRDIGQLVAADELGHTRALHQRLDLIEVGGLHDCPSLAFLALVRCGSISASKPARSTVKPRSATTSSVTSTGSRRCRGAGRRPNQAARPRLDASTRCSSRIVEPVTRVRRNWLLLSLDDRSDQLVRVTELGIVVAHDLDDGVDERGVTRSSTPSR